ncbi:MAG: hypothetical protein ACREBC_28475, partial [Pyrinomonadaceae bacterium]
MRNQISLLVVFALLSFVGNITQAQDVSSHNSKPDQQSVAPEQRLAMSPEEKIVRATYEKLTKLNRAGQLVEKRSDHQSFEDNVLKFELSNFQVGPIRDILNRRHSEIKTGGSGEVISLARRRTTHNNGPEHVSFSAQWTAGQYGSAYDPQWTIGDLFGFEPEQYYDVIQYALYDVKVTFQGKARTYRSLALFHYPADPLDGLRPTFWDSVVGITGSLTDVWNEKRPPVQPVKVDPTESNPMEGIRKESGRVKGGPMAS